MTAIDEIRHDLPGFLARARAEPEDALPDCGPRLSLRDVESLEVAVSGKSRRHDRVRIGAGAVMLEGAPHEAIGAPRSVGGRSGETARPGQDHRRARRG